MNGRHLAYLGIGLGGVISVYGNVAEEYLHPHPAVDAVVLAAAAPVVLFVMTELLTVVQGRGVAAWVVRLATVGVAAVAFSTSYQHLRALLLARGETPSTGALYPLGIDGLLLGSAAVLWQIRRSGQAVPEATEVTPKSVEAPSADAAPKAVEASVAATSKPRRPMRVAAAADPRRGVTVPTEKRTDAELQAEVQAAVTDGRLPANPSAEAIRVTLKVAPQRARALRDSIRTIPLNSPGQSSTQKEAIQ